MPDTGPTLTLRGIAQLAGVQRAVVSTWRSRPRARGLDLPFPAPVSTADSVERFRTDQIVDWLERTGRGNRTDIRLEALSLSVPIGADLEELVTLLCLRAYAEHGIATLSPTGRAELAEQADPDDRFLRTEIGRVAAAEGTLRFIDDLFDASFGLPDALARLESGPAGHAAPRRELTTDAVAVLTALVQSAGLHLDPEGVPIAPAGIPPRLVLVLAEASGAPHLLINGDEPLERELRRWAVLGGRDTATDGGDDALIRVLSVLGLPDGEALDRVDRLVLDLRPHDVAVVVGASSVLCDALRPAAERLRAGTLRLGRLSVALRLPRGLWRHAHRQALGVWVCEGGRNFLHPLIADLSADAPAEIAVGDLAADVSAALVDGRGRAFRYLRPVELATVLAGGPLVPEGARAPRPREAVGHDYLDRAQSAALVVAEPLPALHVFVTASPGAVLQRRRSLGELHEGPGVTVINGRVIGPEHTMPGGSVRVLSADGPVDGLTLDPLDVDRLYPRASRTEPNDVVFVDGARPRAWVDADGGALVASPARILRLRPPVSCGPHTLAAIINTRSRPGEWRTWEIPLLDSGAAAALDAAVAEIAVHDIRLRTRQTALRELTIALLDGVTAGAIDVVPRIADQEGPAT